MRTDSAIASIYDEEGKEIENAEFLFTEEGKTILLIMQGLLQLVKLRELGTPGEVFVARALLTSSTLAVFLLSIC